MSKLWQEVLRESPYNWSGLDAAGVQAWVNDEVAGRGLIGPRDDSEPCDLFKQAVLKGSPALRILLGRAVLDEFCRLFDVVEAQMSGREASDQDRRTLYHLANAIRAIPVRIDEATVRRLERGVVADWADGPVTGILIADYPLWMAFEFAWRKCAPGGSMRRLLEK